MAGINKVIIMGNVGRDPEIRSLSSGDQLATLSIATSETWRDRNSGERKEKTEWHKVTIWGEQRVKLVETYVRKGDMIAIEGKLETRKWQAQDGSDRYSTEIQVKPFDGQLTLIGRLERRDSAGGTGRLRDRAPDGGYPDDTGQPAPAARPRNADLDDEIPL